MRWPQKASNADTACAVWQLAEYAAVWWGNDIPWKFDLPEHSVITLQSHTIKFPLEGLLPLCDWVI